MPYKKISVRYNDIFSYVKQTYVVKKILNFPDHFPIFTEVKAKQTEKQIYHVRIKKIYRTRPPCSWDLSKKKYMYVYQKGSILIKNVGKKTLK